MNLDLIDDLDGLVMRERENYLGKMQSRRNDNSEGMSRFPDKTPLAMAYVPFQQWGEVYDEEDALSRGTLFPELDLPFKGGDVR